MGADLVSRIVPDAQRIGRVPVVGETGIDDLYKVDRPDVDYVVVEYKFGSSKLGSTLDGTQLSDGWLVGVSSGEDRILRSLNGNTQMADSVIDALALKRVEKWLVHTDLFGNVTVGMVDRFGMVVPQPVSKLIGGKP